MNTKLLRDGIETLRSRRCRIEHLTARTKARLGHVSDTDLERYYLGMTAEGPELAVLDEHLLGCGYCTDRAQEAQEYVDKMREAIIIGNWDQVI